MPPAIMKVLHNIDDAYPDELKREILSAVGKIDHIEVWGEEVLVGAFHQPVKSRGGIIMRDADDKWQSKSFLILKLGTKAEKIVKSKGEGPAVGDWCYGMPQECDHLSVKGVGSKMWTEKQGDGVTRNRRDWEGWPCRLVLIGDIRGRTTRPQDIM